MIIENFIWNPTVGETTFLRKCEFRGNVSEDFVKVMVFGTLLRAGKTYWFSMVPSKTALFIFCNFCNRPPDCYFAFCTDIRCTTPIRNNYPWRELAELLHVLNTRCILYVTLPFFTISAIFAICTICAMYILYLHSV